MSFTARQAPLRLTTGAFILNSGFSKRHLDPGTAAYLQTMAAKAIPQVAQLAPEKFGTYLSYAEMGVGTALLTPFVPARLAGLALGAFSGGTMLMYFRTPEMTESDGIRPSQEGTMVAKDIWMVGIALALILGRKGR
ncbi:hypothetical protein [Arthrobacter sp. CAN_A1]|uniref:hypothetical protein n=1 Tax=Arthrobacter sp. CAN_A1 TaxID=2787717 RepID=UPI0018CAF358